jgi:hypothetical protein
LRDGLRQIEQLLRRHLKYERRSGPGICELQSAPLLYLHFAFILREVRV